MVGWARLQLRMTSLLVSTMVSLRRRGTTGTLRHLARRPSHTPPAGPADALRAVQLPGRLTGASCLTQSVALAVALEQMGHRPQLVLGCRLYGDGKWGAHAWVVARGQVLDAKPSGRHAQLALLEAASDWVPAPPRDGQPVR